MPKPNLSSASLDALLKLRDEIAEVLTHRAALLREELSKLGQQIGSKGKAGRSSLKGRKVAVKYRDRSGNTWAGRGAQPVWLREKLKAGAKLEVLFTNPPRNPRNAAGPNAERGSQSPVTSISYSRQSRFDFDLRRLLNYLPLHLFNSLQSSIKHSRKILL